VGRRLGEPVARGKRKLSARQSSLVVERGPVLETDMATALTPPVHTAVFAALSMLLLLALAGRTSQLRLRHRIFAGYGGNEQLRRTSRAHGVSFEHLLPALFLLLCLELLGTNRWAIDAFGGAMLAGRLLQVSGFLGGGKPEVALRRGGMAITYTVEGVLAAALLVKALGA